MQQHALFREDKWRVVKWRAVLAKKLGANFEDSLAYSPYPPF
jgi:hypothetical protein